MEKNNYNYNINNIMEHTIDIQYITDDIVNILGKNYYTEEYLNEMMRRKFDEGKRIGTTIHIAQYELINKQEE